eukprot:TRINITY_DN5078_c2_g1_i1.p1 TRINITY_DN5078_c2_g1~~TRINITY_DN5078_c2_g1_i1.p1  ORF type:complete len:327 (+),score=42.58 TRINITY_DN5078_c2_g1_i1:148-981(+)
MAAIPSTLLTSVQSVGQAMRGKQRDGEEGTQLTVVSNELGARSFFPSSEVTSMPTLKLKHCHRSRGLPCICLKGGINDEYCSAGVGISATIGKSVLHASTARMFQREGSCEGGGDKGWVHVIGAKMKIGRNAEVKLTGGKKVTDSGDKDIVEGRVKGAVRGDLGVVCPEISWVSRAIQGSSERKIGRKIRIHAETAPALNPFGASLYGTHTNRSWAPETSFSSNEIGVTLPVGTSKISVGALQTNATQSELLEQSTLSSGTVGDSRVGLTFRFESQL